MVSKFPQEYSPLRSSTRHTILLVRPSRVSGVPGSHRSSLRQNTRRLRPLLRKAMRPFKVQVGPQQVSIHQGQTVLVSEPDGQINWPSDKGLYFLDTRVISSWPIYA